MKTSIYTWDDWLRWWAYSWDDLKHQTVMDVIMYIYIYIHLCLKYILYSIVCLASYLTVYNYMGPSKKRFEKWFYQFLSFLEVTIMRWQKRWLNHQKVGYNLWPSPTCTSLIDTGNWIGPNKWFLAGLLHPLITLMGPIEWTIGCFPTC